VGSQQIFQFTDETCPRQEAVNGQLTPLNFKCPWNFGDTEQERPSPGSVLKADFVVRQLSGIIEVSPWTEYSVSSPVPCPHMPILGSRCVHSYSFCPMFVGLAPYLSPSLPLLTPGLCSGEPGVGHRGGASTSATS
jgi:hypothetical protein